MEQSKIDRINELARKSRCTPLTEKELAEQKLLREEYIKSFRRSLESQLDSIYIIDEKGEKKKLRQGGC